MKIIEHPERFKRNVRIMRLVGRNKDGAERTCVEMVVTNEAEFDAALSDFSRRARPGQRIYATAAPRNVLQAIRRFKELQLANDYAASDEEFYMDIAGRFRSCLLQPQAELERYWLFDCDTREDTDLVFSELKSCYTSEIYSYPTKSGTHVLTSPFNRSLLSVVCAGLIHENPFMLWGY